MQAQDVMTTVVATIDAGATVHEAAKLMLARRVSALPVIDRKGRVVGVISEGDLVRRTELGTDTPRSWWLQLLTDSAAQDYLKTHGTSVSDVMTSPAISVRRATPLHEVAQLMERHRIKRVPVLESSRLVGIVSRADLVRRLAMTAARKSPRASSDRALRRQALKEVAKTGVDTVYVNITVEAGTVHLWGGSRSALDQNALRAAAKAVNGVRKVEDHTFVIPARLTGSVGIL